MDGKGTISAEICWIPFSNNKEESKGKALLQVFIDSGRNISSKYCPLVELTLDAQTKQTLSSKINNETASWEKHFIFFVNNPEEDSITIKLIDQFTSVNLGDYVYTIRDLILRKNMEHELQAFPLMSPKNHELVMALKLNFLKT